MTTRSRSFGLRKIIYLNRPYLKLIQTPNQKSSLKQALNCPTVDPTLIFVAIFNHKNESLQKLPLTWSTRPTEGSTICAKKPPKKAASESRNFPPHKSRNLKISEKNQTQKCQRQTKPRLHGEFYVYSQQEFYCRKFQYMGIKKGFRLCYRLLMMQL